MIESKKIELIKKYLGICTPDWIVNNCINLLNDVLVEYNTKIIQLNTEMINIIGLEGFMKFNINHTIKVKLLEKGYKHLCNEHNKYILDTNNKKTIDDFEKEVDEDGFTTFQMWDFMNKFGEVSFNGFDLYYETNILINTKEV